MLHKIMATEPTKAREKILETNIVYKNIHIPQGSHVIWNSKNNIIVFHPSKKITINGIIYKRDLPIFLHENGQVRKGCIAKKIKLSGRKTLARETIIYKNKNGTICQISFPEGGRYHQKNYTPGTLLSLNSNNWNVVAILAGNVIEDQQDPHLPQPSPRS
jgi:hypothetical protein